ncbi:hypothetical protein [Streptomyces sp. NPDC055036]
MTAVASNAKNGITVLEHQCRTVADFLELRGIDDDLPITPRKAGPSRLRAVHQPV